MTDAALSHFRLAAIDLRWTLEYIVAKRWTLKPLFASFLLTLK
jgi:hypothetical protein